MTKEFGDIKKGPKKKHQKEWGKKTELFGACNKKFYKI